MKGFRFSKTGILILAAGAFIVILAGLGITRYGQISEQDELNESLALLEARLNTMDLQPLQLELAELQEQLNDSESLLEEAKSRLVQSVVSVNVTDKFYEIAKYNSIIVNAISTTKNRTETYEGVKCTVITINAQVVGDLSHIIDFIIGLNNNFSTGFVQATQIDISDPTTEYGTASTVIMVIYSYEGN